MSARGTILLLDDERHEIAPLAAVLESDYDVYMAGSGEEAVELASLMLPDLIVLDIHMPGMDGYEVCHRLKDNPVLADVPIILMRSPDDPSAELKGLSLGAVDCIAKPLSAEVVKLRINNHIEIKRMRDELAKLAITDALTGLSNRRGLETALDRETSRLARSERPLSVIILDIDFFKRFNDRFGHTAGDRCIMMVAAALTRAMFGGEDLAARYGGEEFACVLPDTSFEEAMDMARMIQHRIEALEIPHPSSDAAPYVTVSVGVASAPCVNGAKPEWWIKEADQQLYIAKNAGRNRVSGTVFDVNRLRSTSDPFRS